MARQQTLAEMLADDTGRIRPEVADLLMEEYVPPRPPPRPPPRQRPRPALAPPPAPGLGPEPQLVNEILPIIARWLISKLIVVVLIFSAIIVSGKWFSSGRTVEGVRPPQSDSANYSTPSENTVVEPPQEKTLPPPDQSKEINQAENTSVQRVKESTENGNKDQGEWANPKDGCGFRDQITRREASNEYTTYKKQTEPEYAPRERNIQRGYMANSFSDKGVVQSVPRSSRVYSHPSFEGSSRRAFVPDNPKQSTYYHRGPVVTETPRRIIVQHRYTGWDNINVRRNPFYNSTHFTYQGYNPRPIRSHVDYRVGYRLPGRSYVIVRRWR